MCVCGFAKYIFKIIKKTSTKTHTHIIQVIIFIHIAYLWVSYKLYQINLFIEYNTKTKTNAKMGNPQKPKKILHKVRRGFVIRLRRIDVCVCKMGLPIEYNIYF